MKFYSWLILAMFAPTVSAESSLIAVASNFSQCFQIIKTEFEQSTSHTARVAYGSTGSLYAQISNGAPYDAFLAADEQAPRRLIDKRLAVSGTEFVYAIGRLQLWSNSYSLAGLSLQDALRDVRLRKLALAKPNVAPYGLAAEQTLEQLGLNEALKTKLVFGENVSQSLQFVSSKNAQLGFAAEAQLADVDASHRLNVPSHFHKPINQTAVLLNKGVTNPAAISLMQFLHSAVGQQLVSQCGYSSTAPDPSKTASK